MTIERLEELKAGAARVISRNWSALSPELGWSGEGPFPAPDFMRNAAADNQLWAMAFQFIADGIWRRIIGSEIPIGFKAGSSGASDGVRFEDFTQNAADWRTVALHYAAVLDELSKRLGSKADSELVSSLAFIAGRFRDLQAVDDANVNPVQVAPLEKPGPEFSKRTDAKTNYFKVWAYLQKPGNSAKSNVQVAESTSVDKSMVGKIRKKTRPPTEDERKAHKPQKR